MKNLAPIYIILSLLSSFSAKAQNVTITPSGITPAVSGTYPRLSYDDITALPSPTAGDIAYDLTFLCLRVYNGTKWVCTYQDPADPKTNISAIITAGGTGAQIFGNDVAVNSSGNIYVTGYFLGTVNFGATSKTAVGTRDAFVAKYNSSGSLQWVQTAGGAGSNIFSRAISLDNSGNVLITGNFSGTVNFGATSKTSAGVGDIFVAKYNSTGVLQWVQTAGGIDSATEIALDATGDVYVAGSFSQTANFGAVSKTSAGGKDIFIAKYSNSGTLQWVQSAGGTSDDTSSGIALDASGSVIITGNFIGSADFGGISKTSVGGGSNIFVAKYSPLTTSWVWVQTAGNTIGAANSNDVVVDAAGNILIMGVYQGTMNFEGISKTSIGIDIFLAKYSNTGSVQWVQTVESTVFNSNGYDIDVDASGNVVIIGDFVDTISFGEISKTNGGTASTFAAKYNTTGELQWVQTASSNLSITSRSIAFHNNGNDIYLLGGYSGIVNFGNSSLTAVSSDDIFLARIQE